MTIPSCSTRYEAILHSAVESGKPPLILTEEVLAEETLRVGALPQTRAVARDEGLVDVLDDVVSTCFIKLLLKLRSNKLDPGQNWKGYVHSTIYNALRETGIASRRRRRVVSLDDPDQRELPDRRQSPDEAAAVRDEIDFLEAALLPRFDASHRAILEAHLRRLHSHARATLQQTADEVGVSLSVVWRVVRRFEREAAALHDADSF